MLKKITTLAIFGVNVGCAPMPKHVTPVSGPTAKLEAAIDSKGFAFVEVCDGDWKNLAKLGDGKLVGSVLSGYSKTKPRVAAKIPAGSRLFVRAGYSVTSLDYNYWTTHSCGVAVSFKPVKGKRYEAVWSEEGNRCQLAMYELVGQGAETQRVAIPELRQDRLDLACNSIPYEPEDQASSL